MYYATLFGFRFYYHKRFKKKKARAHPRHVAGCISVQKQEALPQGERRRWSGALE